MTETSPTARQRELGARLRGFRNEHNMTVEEVADKLLCSATKISRLKTRSASAEPARCPGLVRTL